MIQQRPSQINLIRENNIVSADSASFVKEPALLSVNPAHGPIFAKNYSNSLLRDNKLSTNNANSDEIAKNGGPSYNKQNSIQVSHFTGKNNNRSSRYDELESDHESPNESDINNQLSTIKRKRTLTRFGEFEKVKYEPPNL